MAEVRRKVDVSSNVMLGKDVFALHVKPGFDAAFAMGLVLVLDQISSDGIVDAIISSESDGSHASNGSDHFL
ncbi:Protein LURP-one-related 5 [Bienertia sinuspersici]